MSHPLEHFCCQNSNCPVYGLRDQGNLRYEGYSGHKKHIRMIRCKTCMDRFSERKGTVLEQSRLPFDKAISVLDHLREGCGTRSTGRLVGVSKDTVTRLSRKAGRHAQVSHDEHVAFSPQTREVQADEKWGFVAKKEKHCDDTCAADKEKGDQWDHTAIDAESRLIISAVPGRRTLASCVALIQAVKDKTGGRTDILFTSDEHSSYQTAIAKVYKTPEPESTDNAAETKRSTESEDKLPPDLCYATVRKTREKGRVVEIVIALVIGVVSLLTGYLKRSKVSHTVNTSFVERQNGTDRGQNSRKRRKTYGFSKKLDVHHAMTYFTLYSYNFCWPVRTLATHNGSQKVKRTPAMAAGLTDHIWSIEEWVTYPMVMHSQ